MRGGVGRRLSISSGPSDSSLWADGGASGAEPVVEVASDPAAGRRALRGRRDRAETGAAPGSWRAAALDASSKSL